MKVFWRNLIMTRRTILAVALFTAILMGACGFNINLGKMQGSGKVVSQDREVGKFERVSLQGFGHLVITQGSKESLTIKAEDNIINNITSDVEDGVLILGIKRPEDLINVIPTRPVEFELTVKDLKSIDLEGAGSIEMDELETDSLAITLNGAGNMSFDDVTVKSLTATLNGAGNISVSGKTEKQTVVLNAAGAYEAGDLKSQDASVTLNGVGGAKVWAESNLNLVIVGAGSVEYYGDPKVQQSISGAGNFRSLGKK
jgi:hypothetical protein